MQHEFEKMPDKEIEGIGTFEVQKCTVCGINTSKPYFEGSLLSYFKSGKLLYSDPGCNIIDSPISIHEHSGFNMYTL